MTATRSSLQPPASSRRLAAVAALVIALLFAVACNSAPSDEVERLPAVDGEAWGGFVLARDPFSVTVTPEQPAVTWGGFEGALTEHPGYRRFDTPDDLATFVTGVLGDDVDVLVPQDLPEGATLLDAYAIVIASDQIAQFGLEYALAGSDAPPGDSDVWVLADFTAEYPLVISTLANPQPDSLGRRQLPIERLHIGDIEAIYQPYESPSTLDRALRNRSAITWFDGRILRSIQTRDLPFEEHAALVGSLEEVSE